MQEVMTNRQKQSGFMLRPPVGAFEDDTSKAFCYHVQPIKVSTEAAKYWLEHHNFRRNRTLTRKNIRGIRAAIRANSLGLTLIEVGIYADMWFLLDGQHRLTAMVEEMRSGGSLSFLLLRQWWASDVDMANRYCHIDQGKGRTAADAGQASGLAEDAGLPPTYLSKVCTAAQVVSRGFQGHDSYVPRGSRLDYMRAWVREAKGYYDAISGARNRETRSFLLTSGVMSVGLVTFQHQPERAAEFWSTAASGDLLRDSGPMMLTQVVPGLNRRANGVDGISRAVAECWNCWFLGNTTTKDNVVSKAPAKVSLKQALPAPPMVLLGTSFSPK